MCIKHETNFPQTNTQIAIIIARKKRRKLKRTLNVVSSNKDIIIIITLMLKIHPFVCFDMILITTSFFFSTKMQNTHCTVVPGTYQANPVFSTEIRFLNSS